MSLDLGRFTWSEWVEAMGDIIELVWFSIITFPQNVLYILGSQHLVGSVARGLTIAWIMLIVCGICSRFGKADDTDQRN